MTGRSICKLRGKLGLDPFALAGVLGVHVSTVYRWEANPNETKMDPLQDLILQRLRDCVITKPETATRLGQAIVDGLVRGGTIAALAALLPLLDKELS